jgi:hypothetical protein
LNGVEFVGEHLHPVEHGGDITADNTNKVQAVETYLIRRSDAKAFRLAALGRQTIVDGQIVRDYGARHDVFDGAVAKSVQLSPYLPEQPGDDSGTIWYKASVTFAIDGKSNPNEDKPTSPGDTDANENRTAWTETWEVSVEAVLREMTKNAASPYPERELVYLPQARVTLNNPAVPLATPWNYLKNHAGKINTAALKTPTGQSIDAECALYTGSTARAKRIYEDGITYIEWDLTHQFVVKPHSWNQVLDRTGALVALQFPDGGGVAYTLDASAQDLLDEVGD